MSGSDVLLHLDNSSNPASPTEILSVYTAPRGVETRTAMADWS